MCIVKLSKELKKLYTPDGRIDGGRALQYVYNAMQKMSDEEFLRVATMDTPPISGSKARVRPSCKYVEIPAGRVSAKLKRRHKGGRVLGKRRQTSTSKV